MMSRVLRRACGVLQLSSGKRAWMAAPMEGRESALGLSAMAACILGRPVNKAMQTSAWAQRPLSSLQLKYAALDAHASVQIFERIMTGVSEQERAMVLGLAS